MATSGTYTFSLDLSDILEEAYERAGLNLWTVQEGSQTLTAGTGRYVLSGDELDVIEAFLRTNDGDTSKQSDLTMSRISISQYSHLTNKLTQGRPIQYWIEKDPGAIALNLWPVPDDAVTYKLGYYYIQRVEDTGSPASNNVDIPSRFIPCMAAGLAYYISVKRPEVSERAPLLKQIYEEQWELAADADRDKSSFYMVPGGYS